MGININNDLGRQAVFRELLNKASDALAHALSEQGVSNFKIRPASIDLGEKLSERYFFILSRYKALHGWDKGALADTPKRIALTILACATFPRLFFVTRTDDYVFLNDKSQMRKQSDLFFYLLSVEIASMYSSKDPEFFYDSMYFLPFISAIRKKGGHVPLIEKFEGDLSDLILCHARWMCAYFDTILKNAH